MGTIRSFDLAALSNQFGLRHFIETGTGMGDAIEYAATHLMFRSIQSCELILKLALAAREKFKRDDRIAIANLPSAVFLDTVCRVIPVTDPALFWLDAHFPGADYGLNGYDFERDPARRLPLASELKIIAATRQAARDVIIADDARIWLDGPFQSQNLPPALRPLCPANRNIDFIHEIMGGTHDIHVEYGHEGYIVMTPK